MTSSTSSSTSPPVATRSASSPIATRPAPCRATASVRTPTTSSHLPVPRPAALGDARSEGGPTGSPSGHPWGRYDMTAIRAIRPFRRPRLIGFVAAAILIVVASYAVRRSTAPAAPPLRPGRARQRPPRSRRPARRRSPVPAGAVPRRVRSSASTDPIAAWSKNLAANPLDFISATNLAALYHGRGRLSYDLGDHERALAAARTAIGIEPTHVPARALEATILFTLHDFAGGVRGRRRPGSRGPGQHGRAGHAVRRRARAWPDRRRARRSRPADRVGGPGVTIRDARLASVTGEPGRRARSRPGPPGQRRLPTRSTDRGVLRLRGGGVRHAWPATPPRRGPRSRTRWRRVDDDLAALTRPCPDRRLRRSFGRRDRGPASGDRDRTAAGGAGAARRSADERRRPGGDRGVRDRPLHRATRRHPGHDVRPPAPPVRARPRRRDGHRSWSAPRASRRRAARLDRARHGRVEPLPPRPFRGGRRRDRGRPIASAPTTRGSDSTRARSTSPWALSTTGCGCYRRPRSRAGPRSRRTGGSEGLLDLDAGASAVEPAGCRGLSHRCSARRVELDACARVPR